MVKPVSVGVDASNWTYYSGGIITCYGTQIDHAILAVGWGSNSQGDYWIVENSWGTAWGINGYVLISRDSTNPAGSCGINQKVYYPLTQ